MKERGPWWHGAVRRRTRKHFRTFPLRVEELEPRQLLTLLPAATTATIGVLEDQLDLFTPSAQVTSMPWRSG